MRAARAPPGRPSDQPSGVAPGAGLEADAPLAAELADGVEDDPSVAAPVDAQRIRAAADNRADWLTHGRTYDEQRFSPLARIDQANVKELGLAWYFDLDTKRGQEATPLIIDGTKLASFMAKPGRIRTFTDLAANVSKLSGMHQVGVRLELVGV